MSYGYEYGSGFGGGFDTGYGAGGGGFGGFGDIGGGFMGADDGKPKSTEKKVSCLRIMINFNFFNVWSYFVFSRETSSHLFPSL